MNRDIRRGTSAPRSLLAGPSLSSSIERDDVNHRGYLNRKYEGTMGRKTKLPHREKNWQLCWCNMKGTVLEFFKVDGIRVKMGDPPPKDIYPPKNILRTKIDQLDLDGALVEVDYVSQEKKDIQKRRKHLFHVVLKNNIEYLMQASTENNRTQWVTLMQRVTCNMQVESEDSFLGHAIKTSRDSIKHTSKQTVHRTIIPTNIPTDLSMSAPANEESDYVEFSTAEAIIASGGNPRLQGLRKRLQAKKELLKQLDRMYSSFLGGSAAAMYDDTLILQQLEPPTFNCGSPVLSTSPSDIVRMSSRKTSRKVLHRKLTLSDSAVSQAKSVDRGMDEIEENGVESTEGVDKEVLDRRASTGEMSVPAVITPLSPLPNIQDEVLETELLKDYYLVPGAEWSLLKKGEKVEVIGRAKETGWYRCMALREATVELDRAPLSFIIRSMINMQHSSNEKSGITPEMIEEEYSQRDTSLSLSSDVNTEFLGSDGSPMTPPPLMPKSFPPDSPLGSTSVGGEDIFPVEMQTLSEDVEQEEAEEEEEGGANTQSEEITTDSKEAVSESTDAVVSDKEKKLIFNDGVSNNEVRELGTLEEEQSSEAASETTPASDYSAEASKEEDADAKNDSGDVILREKEKQSSQVKRPLSYEMATGEIQTLESYLTSTAATKPATLGGEENEESLKDKLKLDKKPDTRAKTNQIKRSTSFSPAAINLRTHLKTDKGPRALSVGVNFDSPTASEGVRDSAYYSLKSFSSPKSRLDRLIEREITTGTYLSPLIGCIPPSALKCCVDKGREEKEGGAAPRPISLTQSQSDVGGSIGSDATTNADSVPNSRPVSDITSDAPSDSIQEKKVPVNFEGNGSLNSKSREGSSEPENNPPQNRRFSTLSGELRSSASFDEDSDAEADRRLADMFNTNIVIEPEQDMDLLKTSTRKHVRAKSLPPPLHLRLVPSTPPLPAEERTAPSLHNEQDGPEESSLDIHMSQICVRSPDHMTVHPPSHSVGSSPVHRANAPTNQRRSTSPFISDNKSISGSDIGDSSSSSKPGLLKKLFTRKRATKLNVPNIPSPSSGRTSPGPIPGMLKQVLLGNTGEYAEDMSIARARVSSVSGRPVHHVGMAIVIGDMSSSESEDEDSNHLSSCASLEESSQNQEIPCNGRSSPSSPSHPEDSSLVSLRGKGRTKLITDSPIVDAIFDIAPKPALGKLKRSASEHDSISLKASLALEQDHTGRVPGTTGSLKRNTTGTFGKKMRKQMSQNDPSLSSGGGAVKRNRLSKKKKKRPLSAYATENNELHIPGSTEPDPAIKISGIFRQPPRGEKRFVYLDPSAGKYGFRLQSYGRIREQGKVLQTFVQSVIPGSPSFMAGLYPGDAIVEVNGMDVRYAPVEEVVEAIQKGTVSEERVALKVEFVDGVTRLDCMKKADGFKNEIKARQNRLTELLKDEKNNAPTYIDLPSPQHIILAGETPKWADVIPVSDTGSHTHPYNRHLNDIVAVHSGNIRELECSVLVMPISSCHKAKDITDKNILLQLLQSGGPELLDNLSLAKQCKIGDNISTWGHALPTQYIYHCVFGDLEESLQSCCQRAMEEANKGKLQTIVFWLDGFASLSVSPHIIIEAVRNWLQQDNKRNLFERVIFSSKANSALVENLMHKYFPLFPTTTRDSGSHDNDIIENGCGPLRDGSDTDITATRTGPIQNGNGELESTEEGITAEDVQDIQLVISEIKVSDIEEMKEDKEEDDGNISTEQLLESLQAIQDDTMKTFEELVGQLADCDTDHDNGLEHARNRDLASPLNMFSQSLPANRLEALFHVDNGARSVSPPNEFNQHSRSQSGDMILNPHRTESEV